MSPDEERALRAQLRNAQVPAPTIDVIVGKRHAQDGSRALSASAQPVHLRLARDADELLRLEAAIRRRPISEVASTCIRRVLSSPGASMPQGGSDVLHELARACRVDMPDLITRMRDAIGEIAALLSDPPTDVVLRRPR